MINHISIIVGVTDRCNINCKYCYRTPSSSIRDMEYHTLDILLNKTLSKNKFRNISFIWHGGEPTLRKTIFYKKIIELQKQYNRDSKIRNLIQTNAFQIDDELLDFFCENNFYIGVSIDGPKYIHDLQRTRNGKNISSFDEIMCTISKLKSKKQKFGSICVVTKNSLPYANEIYNFFAENTGSVKFKPMNNIGMGFDNKVELGISPDQYSKFLTELFFLWSTEKENLKIEPFDNTLEAIITGIPRNCSTIKTCSNEFITIQPNGDVYSCADFVGNASHYFGNINKDDIDIILNCNNREKIQIARNQILECIECEYLSICNSGCMASAYMEYDSIDKQDYWCIAHKTVFDLTKALIINKLKQELEVKNEYFSRYS